MAIELNLSPRLRRTVMLWTFAILALCETTAVAAKASDGAGPQDYAYLKRATPSTGDQDTEQRGGGRRFKDLIAMFHSPWNEPSVPWVHYDPVFFIKRAGNHQEAASILLDDLKGPQESTDIFLKSKWFNDWHTIIRKAFNSNSVKGEEVVFSTLEKYFKDQPGGFSSEIALAVQDAEAHNIGLFYEGMLFCRWINSDDNVFEGMALYLAKVEDAFNPVMNRLSAQLNIAVNNDRVQKLNDAVGLFESMSLSGRQLLCSLADSTNDEKKSLSRIYLDKINSQQLLLHVDFVKWDEFMTCTGADFGILMLARLREKLDNHQVVELLVRVEEDQKASPSQVKVEKALLSDLKSEGNNLIDVLDLSKVIRAKLDLMKSARFRIFVTYFHEQYGENVKMKIRYWDSLGNVNSEVYVRCKSSFVIDTSGRPVMIRTIEHAFVPGYTVPKAQDEQEITLSVTDSHTRALTFGVRGAS